MEGNGEVRSPLRARKSDHGSRDSVSKARDRSQSDSEFAAVNRRERHQRRRRHSSSVERDRSADRDRRHRKSSHRHRSRSRSRDGGERRHHEDRKYRHRSRSGERSHHRRRSRSPPSKRRRGSYDEDTKDVRSPVPYNKSRAPLPSQNESFKGTVPTAEGDGPEKQKPNFKPTGLLAKEANTVAGTTTVLKYHEPPEARKPPSKEAWRMYVFKGKDLVDTIYLHQRSAWLFGRDQKVTDYLLEHPSISKQHAVIQFRHITSTNEYGDKSSKVKPYLIDLESANGTKIKGEPVEASKFVELVDGDFVRFGESERQYLMMLPAS